MTRRELLPFAAVSAITSAGTLRAWQQQPLALTHVTVVHPDREGAAAVAPDQTVICEGGLIRQIGPSTSVKAPAGAQTVDGQGKFLAPGLVDSHVHFFQSANPYTRPDGINLTKRVPYAKEVERNKNRLSATFAVWLASGVTSVLDIGGPFWNFEVRDQARRNPLAPRVAVAGPLLSMVADPALDLGDPPIIKITNVDEAQTLVYKELQRKPDYIKVWFIHRPNDDLAAQEAIVKKTGDMAHQAGVPLAVHATELVPAKAALRAGADLLVHSVTDELFDDEFLSLAKARKVLYNPTLYVQLEAGASLASGRWQETKEEARLADPQVLAMMHDLEKIPESELPPRVLNARKLKDQPPTPNAAKARKTAFQNLRTAWEIGLPVLLGTDAGNPGVLHGPSIFREAHLMVEAGLTPAQVLRAATVNGAKAMRRDAEQGRLATGQAADLVLLNGNPLLDVSHLSDAYRVIRNGRVLVPAELIRSLA